MPDLGIKRDPFVALVYVVLILCSTYLLATGRVTARELGGFFAGAAVVPSLWWGRRTASRESASSERPPPKEGGNHGA